MNFPVAVVLFLAKLGISNYGKSYSLHEFINDIISEFGDEAGEKIIDIVSSSKNEIDSLLCDAQLSKIGIPSHRIEPARENTKTLLQHTKISKDMLKDNNCDATRIVEILISSLEESVGVVEEEAKQDVRKALFPIISKSIDTIQKNSDFLFEVLFDIKKDIRESELSISKKISEGTQSISEQLKENAEGLKLLQEQFNKFVNSSKRHDDWVQCKKDPTLTNGLTILNDTVEIYQEVGDNYGSL